MKIYVGSKKTGTLVFFDPALLAGATAKMSLHIGTACPGNAHF